MSPPEFEGKDTPHVLAPPPVICLGALALGVVVQALRPLSIFTHSAGARVASGCLVLGGLTLGGAVVYHFGRAGTLVPALLLVRYGVIAREERYLERRFGQEYRQFCARVRRWL